MQPRRQPNWLKHLSCLFAASGAASWGLFYQAKAMEFSTVSTMDYADTSRATLLTVLILGYACKDRLKDIGKEKLLRAIQRVLREAHFDLVTSDQRRLGRLRADFDLHPGSNSSNGNFGYNLNLRHQMRFSTRIYKSSNFRGVTATCRIDLSWIAPYCDPKRKTYYDLTEDLSLSARKELKTYRSLIRLTIPHVNGEKRIKEIPVLVCRNGILSALSGQTSEIKR
jgi:hypothetical protein